MIHSVLQLSHGQNWFERHVKVYDTKTKASRKPLPIDPKIAETLLKFRRKAFYVGQDEYIFAGDNGSLRSHGIMLADHIKPAAL